MSYARRVRRRESVCSSEDERSELCDGVRGTISIERVDGEDMRRRGRGRVLDAVIGSD